MARPIYSHEILDPDFQWLIQNYSENHPNSIVLDSTCLPVVIVLVDEKRVVPCAAPVPATVPGAEEPTDDSVGE